MGNFIVISHTIGMLSTLFRKFNWRSVAWAAYPLYNHAILARKEQP